jgi:hypothetical protein
MCVDNNNDGWLAVAQECAKQVEGVCSEYDAFFEVNK